MMRFVTAALAMAALVCSGSAMFAQNGELCETRECHFEVFVPPVLRVGECKEISCVSALIRVDTNCQTTVCIDCDDAFIRFERDCDGKLLQKFDSIAASHTVNFFETQQDQLCGGSPLSWEPIGDDCYCVSSHNGGYVIALSVFPIENANLCDDCGCYELECTVQICTVPVDACDCPIVICE